MRARRTMTEKSIQSGTGLARETLTRKRATRKMMRKRRVVKMVRQSMRLQLRVKAKRRVRRIQTDPLPHHPSQL